MKKIYFSYAYTTPTSVSEGIKHTLLNLGVELSFYQKGTTYSDKPIRDCDAFVLFLPDNAFEADISTLSQGIQKELSLAHQLKKDVILAYLSKMAGGVTFYLTDINSRERTIKGISGTNSDVIKLLQEEKEIELGTEDQSDDLDWMSPSSISKINIIL